MVDKDMQLLAVVDLWHVPAVYLALEFRALFVKREMAALAAVVVVSSGVICHDLSLFLFVVMPEMLARLVLHVAQVIGSPVERPKHYLYWELQIAIVPCESNADVEIANAVVAAVFAHVRALGARGLALNHDSAHSGSHFLIKMMVEPQFRQ
ncbi:MAG: hypothetical protein ACLS89_01105 [Collinsella sp.]